MDSNDASEVSKSVILHVLLYNVHSSLDSHQVVQECLNDLNEVSKEADDLRATALFGCCEFDAFLETG